MMKKNLALALVSLALLQGCAGVFVAGGATGGGMATDRRTIGTQLEDQAIEMRALNRLGETKPLWEQSKVSVISTKGKVLLVGQAPTEDYRLQAEQVVKGVPGVAQVYNEIRLAEPVSLSVRTQDTWLTSKVKSSLIAEKNIDATKIKVVTENGEVFLIGLVTQREADISVQIARNVSGVKRVVTVFEFIQAVN
ncbi:division/outer membrane stress-associated lipid-binding lipoprotein [Zobellella aerophila]